MVESLGELLLRGVRDRCFSSGADDVADACVVEGPSSLLGVAGGDEDQLDVRLLVEVLAQLLLGEEALRADLALQDQYVALVSELLELGALERVLRLPMSRKVQYKRTFLQNQSQVWECTAYFPDLDGFVLVR